MPPLINEHFKILVSTKKTLPVVLTIGKLYLKQPSWGKYGRKTFTRRLLIRLASNKTCRARKEYLQCDRWKLGLFHIL